jgi:hypothetical protein
VRVHKGGVRIGKKSPKKTKIAFDVLNANELMQKLKATKANRRRGLGTKEKVSSRRINLEGNTHVQESNMSQLPV